MKTTLPVVKNLQSATFECTFGRGCEGICCQNGRPPVYPEEAAIIQENLARFLPHLRPKARALIEARGFVSGRRKLGLPMLRVEGGWCVFFNQGCVLHKVGILDGDSYQYKPSACALFPLEKNEKGEWYVRQWNYEDEDWNLFCLNPNNSPKLAAQTLAEELLLAARFDQDH